jgi:hypothetical protein
MKRKEVVYRSKETTPDLTRIWKGASKPKIDRESAEKYIPWNITLQASSSDSISKGAQEPHSLKGASEDPH